MQLRNMHKYAKYAKNVLKIWKKICKNMQCLRRETVNENMQEICIKYAEIGKICNQEFNMQNMQKSALPTLLMLVLLQT